MLNSGPTKMGSLESSLQDDLLALLVDGESSVAALYGALIRHCGHEPGLSVSRVMDALQQMDEDGWVEAWQMTPDGSFRRSTEEDIRSARLAYEKWLPDARFEELSLDEVGLWYKLTKQGRAELEARSGMKGPQVEHRWTIDHLAREQLIVVHADSLEVAQEALDQWMSRNADIELIAKSTGHIPYFQLRDGTTVADGVKLVCQYRLRQKQSTI